MRTRIVKKPRNHPRLEVSMRRHPHALPRIGSVVASVTDKLEPEPSTRRREGAHALIRSVGKHSLLSSTLKSSTS